MLYKERGSVTTFFDDNSTIASEAKHTLFIGLPIAVAQVKAGNAFENLLLKIRQII